MAIGGDSRRLVHQCDFLSGQRCVLNLLNEGEGGHGCVMKCDCDFSGDIIEHSGDLKVWFCCMDNTVVQIMRLCGFARSGTGSRWRRRLGVHVDGYGCGDEGFDDLPSAILVVSQLGVEHKPVIAHENYVR